MLAQIRFGILPLHIELCKFRGTKLEERFCQICDTPTIEDKYHFVIICDAYIEIRAQMFHEIIVKYPNFVSLSNMERFLYIMTHEWTILSRYLTKAWHIRNIYIYQNNTIAVQCDMKRIKIKYIRVPPSTNRTTTRA